MQYSEIRSEIKSGDLIAFSHRRWRTFKDIKAQIVRIATRSEYSHVATAWVVSGRVFVIEAVTPLVRIFPLSSLGDFYLIPTTKTWNITAEEYALAQVGKKYSQWQAIKAFFSRLPEDNKWECAELVRAISVRFGWHLSTRQTPTHIVTSALFTSTLTHITNPPR